MYMYYLYLDVYKNVYVLVAIEDMGWVFATVLKGKNQSNFVQVDLYN